MGEQLMPVTSVPGTDTSLLGEEHVRVYRETNGEKGYLWNGVATLLLTSKGRVSGEPRTIPIIFTRYKDSYVIIASKGGSPTHPKWYLNVLDDPNVEVQVKAEKFSATVRTAASPEREEIWQECVRNWPELRHLSVPYDAPDPGGRHRPETRLSRRSFRCDDDLDQVGGTRGDARGDGGRDIGCPRHPAPRNTHGLRHRQIVDRRIGDIHGDVMVAAIG